MVEKFEVGKKYSESSGYGPIECIHVDRRENAVLVFPDKSAGVFNRKQAVNFIEHIEPKKGWINIYPNQKGLAYTGANMHSSKREADKASEGGNREACIEITWKEGDGL